jgi:hypothetical protein
MREAADFLSPIVVFPHLIFLRLNYSKRFILFGGFLYNTVRSIPRQGYHKQLYFITKPRIIPVHLSSLLDTVQLYSQQDTGADMSCSDLLHFTKKMFKLIRKTVIFA